MHIKLIIIIIHFFILNLFWLNSLIKQVDFFTLIINQFVNFFHQFFNLLNNKIIYFYISK